MTSENGVEAEGTRESDNDTENDSQETESSSPETSTAFHSKSPCEHCYNPGQNYLRKCFHYCALPNATKLFPNQRLYVKNYFQINGFT